MGNSHPNDDPELVALLREVNGSMMEFADKPARSASDAGNLGETPLHKIVTWGDAHAARVLLRNGADPNACGEDAETPLHRAIGQKQAAIVKLLLESGAVLDLRDRYGYSARERLVQSNDTELSRVLAEFERARGGGVP